MKLRRRATPTPSVLEEEKNLDVLDVLAKAAEEVEESSAPPRRRAEKKRKRSSSSAAAGPSSSKKKCVKKQYRKICSTDGCTNIAQRDGVCNKHNVNNQRKTCIVEDCTSIAQRGILHQSGYSGRGVSETWGEGTGEIMHRRGMYESKS